MCRPCADGYGRPPSTQVDRREVRPHLCTRRAGARVKTRGAGTRDVVVDLGGQGPLALSPRLNLSPIPSCPASFCPQHLTVASSCGEKQPRISHRFSKDGWGESFTQGLGNSRSHGARPVSTKIISMSKWVQTSRFSTNKSFSLCRCADSQRASRSDSGCTVDQIL